MNKNLNSGGPNQLSSTAAGRVVEELRQLARDRLLPALPILDQRGLISREVLQLGSRPGLQQHFGNAPAADRVVIQALEGDGIRVLALKGTLLGHTVYEHEGQRLRSDTDLLVPPEQRYRAHEVLRGLKLTPTSQAPQALTLETQSGWWGSIEGQRVQIDLHWQLFNHPAFAFLFDFEELWENRQPFTIAGHQTYGLSLGDALLHSALHYFAHHEEEDRPAQWLLDGILLWQKLHQTAQLESISKATRLEVAGILGEYLQRADKRFQAGIDNLKIRQLQQQGRQEWRSRILTLYGRPLANQLFVLRSVKGWRGRTRYVQKLVFPSPAYMRFKYPEATSWMLPWLYVKRATTGWKRRIQ
jgi:hypothetical protein